MSLLGRLASRGDAAPAVERGGRAPGRRARPASERISGKREQRLLLREVWASAPEAVLASALRPLTKVAFKNSSASSSETSLGCDRAVRFQRKSFASVKIETYLMCAFAPFWFRGGRWFQKFPCPCFEGSGSGLSQGEVRSFKGTGKCLALSHQTGSEHSE